ncbi:PaaI family thioesterase [Noviherbaspirillum cavernae]|uniref:PaaI family thioesterase n=1 Tax=Noviherbaspirillum cavernae TaxID=2320862 RepID=A0A418WWZ5_9BURK|nr:PaaI family thioesterase [Noviherbaspirillum cavernae]RJG04707.1 PaaI family thioesterase [Noviherbaspirillum cavernae]
MLCFFPCLVAISSLLFATNFQLRTLAPGKRTTTVESSTKFIAAAPSGATVTGVCTAFHRGRTTMVWQTEIRTADDRLCAVVTQTQLVLG